MKGFNDYHKKGEVKLQETEQEFHERVVKHRQVDSKRYPKVQGLEGPYTDLNGKVYYYDPREGLYYDPDTDIYLKAKDLRLP
ncbi:hypothetical protein NVP1081O_161 [Vibrio phage 1.081.O._10N.286.52.C2]|nr:hypothetical protein NVP1081O_161 [Vibrio phage 1.081.O._10N.286.52.C2]